MGKRNRKSRQTSGCFRIIHVVDARPYFWHVGFCSAGFARLECFFVLSWLTMVRAVHNPSHGCANLGSATWLGAAFGLLLPWLLLAVSAETQNAVLMDDTGGMGMVALVMFVLLLALRVIIQRRWRAKQRENCA